MEPNPQTLKYFRHGSTLYVSNSLPSLRKQRRKLAEQATGFALSAFERTHPIISTSTSTVNALSAVLTIKHVGAG